MKTYRGVGSIAPHILASILDRDEWSASCWGCFTPREVGLQYPLDGRLLGSQNLSGHHDKKNPARN